MYATYELMNCWC